MKTLIIMAMAWSASVAVASEVTAPIEAKVYFVHLQNGDIVTSPFKVIFGLSGMGVAPAGVDPVVFKNVGHHHLFINAKITQELLGQPIPADDQHLHFGQGQTETTLSLAPGTYTLRLVLGDPYHQLHQPVIESESITIQVRKNNHEN